MKTIEVTAKSLDEAISQAAKQLGVPTEAINATVLEESKGLFGKSQIRIRAELKPLPDVPPHLEKKGLFGKAKSQAAMVVDDATETEEPEVEAQAEPAPAPTKKASASRARKPKAAEVEAEGAPPAAATPATPAEAEEQTGPAATQKDADQLLAIIESLMEAANLDVHAKIESLQGRYVSISLDGKDVSVLVGKHGEVLNALQYLVNIIGTQQYGNGIRATIDGDDYRRRREEKLAKLAEGVAAQVKERGEEAVLDALPAFERRIVHKVLSEFPGVQTYSEGEEPNRRIVIAPID